MNMKKKYCKPKTEAIAMETNLFVMQSNKTTLKSGDNQLQLSDSQTTGGAPQTGSYEVVEPGSDLEGAKRWGWYTGPFE